MSTNLRRFIQHEIKLTYLHHVIYNKKIKAQYYFEEKKEALFILLSFTCKNSLKVITVDEPVNIDILCNKLVTRELCGLYNLSGLIFFCFGYLYKQYLHPYAIMIFEMFKCNRIFLLYYSIRVHFTMIPVGKIAEADYFFLYTCIYIHFT